jgi:hypothetical protein
MDSANRSGGLAAYFAVLVARLTGRHETPPEPASAPAPDLPEETWAHGESFDIPMPRADLIAQMSEAEQAEYWRDWAAKVERESRR